MAVRDYRLEIDTKDWNNRVERLLDDLSPRQNTALWILMQTYGMKMADFAKGNRPWTDRTGDARRSLNGGAIGFSDSVAAYVAHGVWYGYDLELSYQRKYAILERARNSVLNELSEGIQGLLRKTS